MKSVIEYLIGFIAGVFIGGVLVMDFHNQIHSFLYCLIKSEWAKLIITTLIGGLAASLIAYWIMIWRENKKDIHRKKEKCTAALLATQMALILQMQEIKAREYWVNSVLEFKLCGEKLCEHFKDISDMEKQKEYLFKMNQDGKYEVRDLGELLQHIIIRKTDAIVLPYEIFEIPIIKSSIIITTSELAEYFFKLANCNREDALIHSLFTRHNQIFNKIIFPLGVKTKFRPDPTLSPLEADKVCSHIAGCFSLAKNKLKPRINDYLKNANNIFSLTEKYIKFLGIAESIPTQKDNQGNIIFDIQDNYPGNV